MKTAGFLLPLLALVSLATAAESFVVETVAGAGRPGNSGDSGAALQVNIDQPFGVEVGPDGALYITEVGQHRVRRLDLKTGQISTVAGCGRKGYAGDGGLATEALLNEPYEVRFDTQGNMVFVEMQNHVVRRVDRQTGKISTIAGTGQAGFAGDGGPATKAQFRQPHSIAFDRTGALYIADILNHRIRRVDPRTGIIESIAGNGEQRLPKPGSPAAGQPIRGPRALQVDGKWLWIALREGNSVWKLDLDSGSIAHVAGSGKKGFSGDDGNPLLATFDGPKGVAIDKQGRVVVMDTENQAVREISADQSGIRTIAGQGPKGRGFFGDGGPALDAQFDRPHGICTAPDGSIYIGDTNNHRVRRLRPVKDVAAPGEPTRAKLATVKTSAKPEAKPKAKTEADGYVPMPWHLIDTWWDIGREVAFETYSVDVTISEDVSPDVNLYIAPIGRGDFGKTIFYGGIQTQADGNTKRDERLRKIGPGFLFSMWGERSYDAIRPAEGGLCQSSGHEGDFVSVRRPYAWTKGTYTFRMVSMDKQQIDGKPYTWIGAFVYSHAKDENIFVGALRFAGDHLTLSRNLANFVEIYGTRKPVDEIPKLVVTFGNLQVNGQPVNNPKAYAIYPEGVPDYAQAVGKDNTIVITVGQPIQNRTVRRVPLLGQ
jgi:streptogramin lyase